MHGTSSEDPCIDIAHTIEPLQRGRMVSLENPRASRGVGWTDDGAGRIRGNRLATVGAEARSSALFILYGHAAGRAASLRII